MNQYLVDKTREHLIGAAAYAVSKEVGDLSIQILAKEIGVEVRACGGGVHRTWYAETVDWDELATARVNPLPARIDGILFRLERGIAAKGESQQ